MVYLSTKTYPGGNTPVKFRGGPVGLPSMSLLSKMFNSFETSYEPGFILLSKITGNVLPRIAVTRTADERKEVAFNEITQGSTLFLSLPLLSPLGNFLQRLFSGVPMSVIKGKNETVFAELTGEALRNIQLAKLGKSLGVSAMVAALLLATTYLRNYRTIKKTGFSDYKKVVGLGNAGPPTAQDKRDAEAAMRKNLNIIKGLLIGGGVAWLAISGGFAALGKWGKKIFEAEGLLNPQRLKKLVDTWTFVGKNSNQIRGIFNNGFNQILWIWGIPSYAGWILGCRDKYEVVEQLSKFATFCAGYLYVPGWVGKLYDKSKESLLKPFEKYGGLSYRKVRGQIAEELQDKAPEAIQKLESHMNKRWLWVTLANVLAVGLLPIIFNIFFSEWRHRREEAEEIQNGPASRREPPQFRPATLDGQPLRRKTVEEWVHHAG